MAETYLATDTGLPNCRRCVVKQIKTPKDKGPDVLNAARVQFYREAHALDSLGKDHPQIPELYAYCEENENFYLVQEFIAGEPLSAELSPGTKWEEKQVIELLQDVLGILKFVHNYSGTHNNITYEGIIHRDINPSNLIRRSQDKKIVLIDFGAVKEISCLKASSQGHEKRTKEIGTTGYMPTEQGSGNPKRSSDIYALGMVCIQAITGVTPKDLPNDSNTGEIIWRSIPDQPTVQVSDRLAIILEKMVLSRFDQRYQSASEVLQDLADLQRCGQPTQLVEPDSRAKEMVGRRENFLSDLRAFFLGIFPGSLSSWKKICLFISAGILMVVFTPVYFNLPILVILTSGAKSWKSIGSLVLMFVGIVLILNGIFQAIPW